MSDVVEPLGAGRIEPRELEQEMRSSYLDYAMSVIVGRALPDVRDGLKPVHRRVLWAMHDAGHQPNRPYVKCARVTGDVMGKYHPHDSSSIYDAIARLVQPFSLRYPLVDGQGNFGSIDDDPPAAERYTECRLAKLATEMLRDIDSDTVDFGPNYDESRREPQVLPSRFPNLLVNGSTGIAVGMATNIPPHNLAETIDAVVALIDKPTASVEDLMKHVKGPDFPTGGIVVGRSGIRDAYRTGRGRIIMRARAHVEELRGGKSAIIVTELPYGVKKGGDGGVISKIADLVREKVITEVSDLQDYSDKTGMRIQIELKREAVPQVALNKLFKHTALQTTFGYNAVALVDGVPRTLSLLEFVRHYLDFQREVVTRRSQFELRKALARAHVLEGYLIALDNLDEVIQLIRAADDADEARAGLIERFAFSELQAQAILDLRLRALTGLERKRVEDEYADLQERISELRALLGDESRIAALIKEELLELREIYGKVDERRTEIVAGETDLELEDMIAEEDMVIAITKSGYIKRLPVTTYREQRRGGIGVMGMEMKDDDYIEHLFVASTHDYILFFTTVGKVYRLKVHELPLGSRQSKGRAIVNLLPFRQDEYVQAVIATRNFEEAKYLVFATRKGMVKKTEFVAYNTPLKADGIIAIKLREDDELIGVRLAGDGDDVLMVSRLGQAVRFHGKQARAMGRDTSGVAGMKLRGDDEVIELDIAVDDADLLVVTENGYGKRTRVGDYPVKGRGTMGVKTVQLVEGKGRLAGARIVRDGYQVMLISDGGTVIRIPGRRNPPRGPLDPGRHRDAPPRGRAGRDAGAGGRLGRRRRDRRRRRRRADRPELRRLGGVRELLERGEKVDRDRKDDRRVVGRSDLEQRLQVTQLNGDRLLGHDGRGVLQPLGRLVLAFGGDDLRAALALGFGLPCHRTLHAGGDLDVLDLDDGDLDPPRGGRLVDDRLQDRVDLVALGEELVEHVLAEHRAQSRLRDLRGRDHVVLDLNDRVVRLDDPEVGDRIHTDRDVVLRDHLLRRDVERHRAQVDLDHPVDDRDQEEEPGPFGSGSSRPRRKITPRSYSRAILTAAKRINTRMTSTTTIAIPAAAISVLPPRSGTPGILRPAASPPRPARPGRARRERAESRLRYALARARR